MVDKKEILKKIIEHHKSELQALINSAHEAKSAATDPEAKAENKYDTRGLEASYLAGAQAKRAQELKDDLFQLEKLEIRSYNKSTPIETTALIKASADDEDAKWFFLVPERGGLKLKIDNIEVLTLSMHSPLGKNFYKRKQGDFFDLEINDQSKEYEILEVY